MVHVPRTIDIMVVEDSRQFAKAIQSFFSIKNIFRISGIAHNSLEAIELLKTLHPDIILLDLVMPHSDGFVLLEYLNATNEGQKPDVIVLTSLNHEAIIKRASDLGASYYMAKPVSLEDLHARCMDLRGIRSPKPVITPAAQNDDPTLQHLPSVLLEMGIPAQSKGYDYLIEAIRLVRENPDLIYNLTRQLYPLISGKFQVGEKSVERAMRHAIEVAWKRDRLQNANKVIKAIVFTATRKPANGEFISIIAKKCTMDP
jgi:two-component system, response regulator, stage 0 sporulation protein A